ncbi:MAG: division/cell wall cluster transcriptional repressor MraZ [Acidiferrobacteraceae bacterium]
MYRGINNLMLDGKSRLAVPARYREPLLNYCEGRMVLTVDPDQSLLLYPVPEWDVTQRKLTELPTLNPKARALHRLMSAYATYCEMDGNGRVLLPAMHREFAGIERAVVMIGQSNKFEIWDENQWNTRRAQWLEAIRTPGALSPEMEKLTL